jgi:hypothetical protein
MFEQRISKYILSVNQQRKQKISLESLTQQSKQNVSLYVPVMNILNKVSKISFYFTDSAK